MIGSVGFALIRRLLGLVGMGSAPDAKDITVLGHQLMVFCVGRPAAVPPTDRLVLALLARLLPRERWPEFRALRRRLRGCRDGRAGSDHLLTAADGAAEGAEEVGDEQGRAGRVDVAGRVHRRSECPGGRADGDGGERLHAWMAGDGPDGQIDIGVRRELDATVGATVVGRRTFDLGVGPWGGTPWPGIPSFVVTHRVRQDLLGSNGGMFAFDSLEAAVRRAKQAAEHKDVMVLGADVARQLLRADLLDEVRIHLVPLLLGAGIPLFDGEQAELIPEGKPVTGTVTHLRFRVATA